MHLFWKQERVKQIEPSEEPSGGKNIAWLVSKSSYRKKLYAVVEKRP